MFRHKGVCFTQLLWLTISKDIALKIVYKKRLLQIFTAFQFTDSLFHANNDIL